MRISKWRLLSTLGLLTLISTPATAQVLTFEGLPTLSQVGNFYDGGTGGNYGVTFSSGVLAAIDSDAPGGNGNFANEPSPSTVLVLTSDAAVMNVLRGFTGGFSLFYSSPSLPGSINVYDGGFATGNVLATLNLAPTGTDCVGDPNGTRFCNWVPIGVSFAGTARSIGFSGIANQLGFDNITLGAAIPGGAVPAAAVPEPASWAMMLVGFGAIGAGMRRRRARPASAFA